MKYLISITGLILLFVCPAFGDPSADLSETNKDSTAFDQNTSSRKSLETKLTEVKKKASTTSENMDKTTSDQVRKLGQAINNRGIDIELPLQVLFLDILSRWEEEKRNITSWQILTEPALTRDFGLSSEIRPGMIDTVKSDYLQRAASGNALLSSVYANETALKDYIKSLAFYGCLVGQAYLNLQEDLSDLGIKTVKDDADMISGNIAYDDFIVLAEGALEKALKEGFSGTVKTLYESILRDQVPCQFDGSVDRVKCGRCIVVLTAPPSLSALGRFVYGNDSFAGFKGTYRISSGMSFQKAIEELKSTSRASKFAREVTKTKEDLIAQGQAKDAVMLTKVAFESLFDTSARVTTGRPTPF